MFRFMDKYRVHILLVVLLAMVGFGAWASLVDLVGSSSQDRLDPEEVWATAQIFGEEQQISLEDVKDVMGFYGFEGDEDTAGAVLASIIRKRIAESDHGFPVAPEEVELALKERFQEPLRQINGGRFDKEVYAQFVANFRMTPQQFEAQVAEDLRLAKTLRELARAGSMPSLVRIIEVARKDNQKIKVKGVFWDSASFKEAAKLSRDDNGNLTAESIASLQAYFDELNEDEKRALALKGPMVTVDFLGYDFSLHADDQAFLDDYARVHEASGKSLEQICAEIEITPEDVTVMKERLARMRDAYGLDADADVEAVWTERQARFEAEIRVIKHVRALWSKLDGEIKSGQEVDLAQVAADNNLIYFEWKDRYLTDLSKDGVAFQSGGLYQLQLASNAVGNLLDMRNPPGSTTMHFGTGAVDVIGRHIAAFRLLARDMQPLARFSDPDVRESLVQRLENKRTEELRDEAFQKFQDRMTEITSEKAKEKIDEIRARFDEEIAEAVKDLDPEKEEDKARIEEITTEKNDEAEALMDEARAEHRSAAFDQILEETPDAGLVVEEGFFRPFDSTREQPVDREAAFETRARSSLRREFRSLHDQNTMEIYIEPGTVSDVVQSSTYPGLKGVAKLVEKKTPTDRELLLRPSVLRISAMNAARAVNKERGDRDLWDFEALKTRNFKVDPGKFMTEIEKFRKREEERSQMRREFDETRRRLEEQRKAAENKVDDANVTPGERGLSTVPGQQPVKPVEKTEDEKAAEKDAEALKDDEQDK